MGSANILTDRTGALVRHYEYHAFGKARYDDAACTFNVSNRYTGQIFDEDTGLYYYNARYYDAELGRFIQPDTIVPDPFAPQTLNRYSYCNNNPLNYIDPSGHVFEKLLAWLRHGASEFFRMLEKIFTFGAGRTAPVLWGEWVFVYQNDEGEWVETGESVWLPMDPSAMSALYGSSRGKTGFGETDDALPSYEPPYGEAYVEYYLSELEANPFLNPFDRYLDLTSGPYKDSVWSMRDLTGISSERMGNIGPGYAYTSVWGTQLTALGAFGGEALSLAMRFLPSATGKDPLSLSRAFRNPWASVGGPAWGSWRDNFKGMTYAVSDRPFRTAALSLGSGVGMMMWSAAFWTGRMRDWLGP